MGQLGYLSSFITLKKRFAINQDWSIIDRRVLILNHYDENTERNNVCMDNIVVVFDMT